MRSVGCACGSAPFSPEATIVSNESSSAPCACKSSRSRQASSRSLRPTNVSAVSASKPRSAMPRRLGDLRDLVLVLDRPDAVDEAARRHELRGARAQPLPLEVRQHIGLELHAPLQPRADVGHHRALRHLHLDAGDAARRLGVAEVRVERRAAAGLDEQRGVRAVEARQVEDVRQVRDEQRRVEPRGQRVKTLAHFAASAPARNSSASR